MKRTIIYSLMATIMFASLASCNKPLVESTSELQIEVNAVPTKTIIEDQKLPDGSAIGLFLAEAGETTYDDLSYANVKYTAAGSGASQVWNPERSVYLSTTNGTVNAYFPYSSTVNDIAAIPVETASQTDYMWATTKTGVANTNATVPLTMNHALAAIRISITKGTYTGTGKVTKVAVSSDGLATEATMNATTGGLTGFDGNGTDIDSQTADFTVTGTATKKTILAIPNGQNKIINLKLTIDGTTFMAQTAAAAPAVGTITTYNLTLNAENLTIDGVTVTPWNETDKGNVDLKVI